MVLGRWGVPLLQPFATLGQWFCGTKHHNDPKIRKISWWHKSRRNHNVDFTNIFMTRNTLFLIFQNQRHLKAPTYTSFICNHCVCSTMVPEGFNPHKKRNWISKTERRMIFSWNMLVFPAMRTYLHPPVLSKTFLTSTDRTRFSFFFLNAKKRMHLECMVLIHELSDGRVSSGVYSGYVNSNIPAIFASNLSMVTESPNLWLMRRLFIVDTGLPKRISNHLAVTSTMHRDTCQCIFQLGFLD